MLPRLLVSVRDAVEARFALVGGADIIDVKEPANGPLGMASPETMVEVATVVAEWNCSHPHQVARELSLAFGEVTERDGAFTFAEGNPRLAADITRLAYAYRKLGTSHLLGNDVQQDCLATGASGMQSRVLKARQLIDRALRPCDGVSIDSGDGRWIAVGYADSGRCQAPTILDVAMEAQRSSDCTGLLIDTYQKDGSGLLQWTRREELMSIRELTSSAGLMFALAGQVTARNLPELVELCPDVIGVRGAVCGTGDRRRAVSSALVAAFKAELCRAFQ